MDLAANATPDIKPPPAVFICWKISKGMPKAKQILKHFWLMD
jgi:hypothetical protein